MIEKYVFRSLTYTISPPRRGCSTGGGAGITSCCGFGGGAYSRPGIGAALACWIPCWTAGFPGEGFLSLGLAPQKSGAVADALSTTP